MRLFVFTIFFLCSFNIFSNDNIEHNLIQAIDNPMRKEENQKRDVYRNPKETLSFFGITRKMKVLEIIPGRGWYTEIIGNLMMNTNNFFVATYQNPQYSAEILKKIQKEFELYFSKNKEYFGNIQSIFIDENYEIASQEKKFDMVLTFRNSHNWLNANKADNMYKSIYKVMKKGGILGVVQHRADESLGYNYRKGYVKESFLIELIEKKGFKLVEKSEINANPKDLKNYEDGVWRLPPRLALGEKNRQKYIEIGESDRMTLKFVK